VLTILLTSATAAAMALAAPLPGFERSRYFDEQVVTYTFDAGAGASVSQPASATSRPAATVRVHINAPSAEAFDPAKPLRIVLYALPNGNTIEQTVGRQRAEGVDWHFYIQHIGAQTRRLREVVTDQNIVVAYVEANVEGIGKSWPRWRQTYPDSGERILKLIDSIRSRFPGQPGTVDLLAHSGGGSLLFGFINQVDRIPDWIGRIVWLDANYGYSDDDRHGDKLIEWLGRSPDHYLGVFAYDDRRIEVNGKPVIGPDGGTYRRTHTMVDRLRRDMAVTGISEPAFARFHALDGRVEIIILDNPDNAILHTVLVEKNGYLHALTFGTPHKNQAGTFWGEIAYEKWIQPD